MGGLVIKSMVIDYLRDGRSSDLKKIEHILFLATPNRGVDIPLLMRLFNPQLGDLFVTSKLVDLLEDEWVNKVYAPRISPGSKDFQLEVPFTPVVGLEDSVVSESSVRSVYQRHPPATVPGGHVSMKEPESRDDLVYRVVKNKLKEHAEEYLTEEEFLDNITKGYLIPSNEKTPDECGEERPKDALTLALGTFYIWNDKFPQRVFSFQGEDLLWFDKTEK